MRQAGVVCALGRGLDALVSGMRRPPPEPSQFYIPELASPLALPYLHAAFTHGTDARNTALLDAAVEDALAGMRADERADTALFLASSSIDLFGEEPHYASSIAGGEPAVPFMRPRTGGLARWLAQRHGLGGADYTINTACSSGANALLYAAAALERSHCRHALVVGLETPSRVTLAGFQALMLLAADGCRPFDAQRNGILLGEAACALLLSADPAAGPLRAWQLRGGASACDTSSLTHTSAEAVTRVVNAAMEASGSSAPVAVKAHGTGTAHNDLAESTGLHAIEALRDTPLTALKPVLGHTLGACGVLETIAMAACANEGFIPACQGLEQADPDLPLAPRTTETKLSSGDLLLTFFGFGGNNCALVLGPAA